MFQLFVNNAYSTLSADITSGAASLTVQSGHGARFPRLQAGDFFLATLDDGTNVEIIRVVAVATDTFTMLRAQEGTTAAAFNQNVTRVELRWTEEGISYKDRTENYEQIVLPAFNVTSFQPSAAPLPTITAATRTAITMNNSGYRARQLRTEFTSALSANAPIKLFHDAFLASRHNGFRFTTRFGVRLCPNSSHFWIGLVNTTAAMNSVHPPSSLLSAIVLGWTSNANSAAGLGVGLSIWRNDDAGNAVELPLGSNFTVNTEAFYELSLQSYPKEARIDYRVRRLDISSIADASSFFTTDIPPASHFLAPALYGATMQNSALSVNWGGWGVKSV